ncbi:methyltransferase domain-containing protein [Methanoregula sp.]|jgi:SAM-dependent methyltransferase|uniref:methyltransferase domain-containing protein n=1 Tax=Methanoregula sp. TaxID=2052170 RepID=UPI0025F0D48C|nr:methyltransferase domain-containing protein [Methanoregula sp.]
MKEEEIRPTVLFEEYLSLAEKDITTFFSGAPCKEVSCPACGSEDRVFRFNKKGFDYCECRVCQTLYVNPRPDEDIFNRFYLDAESVRFWATHFYKETERARQDLLITPKAKMAGALIRKHTRARHANPVVVDIGAGYGGFCVALKSVLEKPYIVMGIEPALALQEVCREKKIHVIPKFLGDVGNEDFQGCEVVAATSFELLEHLYNPQKFIRDCHHILHQHGILILTTLNGKGFDLQMLGDKSRSISPPHHINFFNPRSVRILLERQGFEILEISTPGKLDVDMVSKQLPDVTCPFVRELISVSDDNIKGKLQAILQETRTSSHMMIVARKK